MCQIFVGRLHVYFCRGQLKNGIFKSFHQCLFLLIYNGFVTFPFYYSCYPNQDYDRVLLAGMVVIYADDIDIVVSIIRECLSVIIECLSVFREYYHWSLSL